MADAAVVLLSGGLDSTTTLAIARAQGHDIYALSFRYGQQHAVELDCARRQAERHGVVAHEVVELDHVARLLAGSSALLPGGPEIPDAVEADGDAIPSTYVPARNTLFLSYGLAWAEAIDARTLWTGVTAVDYSGYPDCRPRFIDAFEHLANLATKAGVEAAKRGELALRVHTPLIGASKVAIILEGHRLGVDYADTVSCYRAQQGPHGVEACGRCESCAHRQAGFTAANIADPTRYAGARDV